MGKKQYYGLFSTKALGVFTDYDTAFRYSRGLRKNRIKKFPTYKEAYDYAREGFNDCQDDIQYMTFPGVDLGQNRLIYGSEIRRQKNG